MPSSYPGHCEEAAEQPTRQSSKAGTRPRVDCFVIAFLAMTIAFIPHKKAPDRRGLLLQALQPYVTTKVR